MGRRGNAYGNVLDLDGDGGGVADFLPHGTAPWTPWARRLWRPGRQCSCASPWPGCCACGAESWRSCPAAVFPKKLAALLRPALRWLLPRASRDPETLAAVSANVSANLLGLGNAATPLGIERPGAWPGNRRHRRRRAVPPGGAEHGVAAAAAHHGGRGAGGLRLPDALRYPAGGMAVAGHLRDGGGCWRHGCSSGWRDRHGPHGICDPLSAGGGWPCTP